LALYCSGRSYTFVRSAGGDRSTLEKLSARAKCTGKKTQSLRKDLRYFWKAVIEFMRWFCFLEVKSAGTIHEITRSNTNLAFSDLGFRVVSWIVFLQRREPPGESRFGHQRAIGSKATNLTKQTRGDGLD
jgi:hypothetical protein